MSTDKKRKTLLYRRAFDTAQNILMCEWDPIGVCGEPTAQDEYDAYIPGALRMIIDGRSDQEIADYLEKIETGAMGLNWAEGIRERNLRVAQRLQDAVQPFLDK